MCIGDDGSSCLSGWLIGYGRLVRRGIFCKTVVAGAKETLKTKTSGKLTRKASVLSELAQRNYGCA